MTSNAANPPAPTAGLYMTYFWKTFFDNFFIKFTLLVLISKVLLQCAASSVKCFNAFMCFYWRGNHLTKSFVMQSLVCLHFEFRRGKLGINCVRGSCVQDQNRR